MIMKRQTFIKLLLTAIIIAGCGNAKNTNADVASSKEEMQQAEETGDDALKLTTLKLTDKEWLAVKSSYDKLKTFSKNEKRFWIVCEFVTLQ